MPKIKMVAELFKISQIEHTIVNFFIFPSGSLLHFYFKRKSIFFVKKISN